MKLRIKIITKKSGDVLYTPQIQINEPYLFGLLTKREWCDIQKIGYKNHSGDTWHFYNIGYSDLDPYYSVETVFKTMNDALDVMDNYLKKVKEDHSRMDAKIEYKEIIIKDYEIQNKDSYTK